MILDKSITWENLKVFLQEKNYKSFGRSILYDAAYEREKKINNIIYNSPEDVIKIKYLNYWSTMNENKKLCAVRNKLSKKIAITMNLFPYYVEADHMLFWSEKELKQQEIQEYLGKHFGKREFIFFRNPPERRTVPNLFHVQVFVKSEKL